MNHHEKGKAVTVDLTLDETEADQYDTLVFAEGSQ